MYDNWFDRFMQANFWAWPLLLILAIFLAGMVVGGVLTWLLMRWLAC